MSAVSLGLISCVAIGAVVIDRGSPESPESLPCAGVGFADAPTASTPEGALAAFLDTQGGDAVDWERSDHRTDRRNDIETYDFKSKRPVSRPNLALIIVRGRDQTWNAFGGCVA